MTTTAIDKRMIKARSSLIMMQGFWGTLALKLKIVETKSITETMATDAKHLWYNPKFLDTLTPAQTIGVIAHEASHCACKHPFRRGDRSQRLWNIACDYRINSDLLSANFELPPGGLFDTKKRFIGMTAEEIYHVLDIERRKNPPKPQPPQQPEDDESEGESGQGQGENDDDETDDEDTDDDAESNQGDDDGDAEDDGDDDDEDDADGDDGDDAEDDDDSGDDDDNTETDEGEGNQGKPGSQADDGLQECPWGEVLDAPAQSAADKEDMEREWEVLARQALGVAAARNAGELPDGLKLFADDLQKKQIDWRDQLRRFIDSTARRDYSWSRPNRRFVHTDTHLPSLLPDGIAHIGVVIDTSGSIISVQHLLSKFKTEAKSLLDEGIVDRITLLCCDDHVTFTREFERGDDLAFAPLGGGGTAFSPAFNWFENNADDLTAVIYFTDLECFDHGSEPEYPVLWVNHGSNRYWIDRVKFGEVIQIM